MTNPDPGSGIAAVGPAAVGEGPPTIILVGLNKDRPSPIAAALRQLGVDLGVPADENAGAHFLEDFEREDDLRSRVAHRSELAGPWGFELCDEFRWLPSALHLFQNPRVVVMLEDPLAVVGGSEAANGRRLAKQLTALAGETLTLLEVVTTLPAPTLLISREKAFASPSRLVSSLCDHCGIVAREGQRLRAIRSVEEGREICPPTMPIWYEGRLGDVGPDKMVRGWARRMPGNEPCMVEIVSQGRVIGRGLSNQPIDNDDSALCQRGFVIALPSGAGGEIVARVAGTTVTLSKQHPRSERRTEANRRTKPSPRVSNSPSPASSEPVPRSRTRGTGRRP